MQESRRITYASSGEVSTSIEVDGIGYKTPTFVAVNSDRKHEVKVKGHPTQTYRCDVDFRNSVLPDLILAAIPGSGPILAGGSLMYDWATGSIYNCSDRIKIKLSSNEKAPPYRKRILILPPKVSDPIVRDRILREWKTKTEKFKESENFYVLDIKKSWERLENNGFVPSKIDPPQVWQEHRLRRLGYMLRFTHILYYDVETEEGKITLFPHLYNVAHKDLEKNNHLTEKFSIKYQGGLLSEYFWNTFKFIPNSIFLGVSGRPTITSQAHDEESVEGHPDSLPGVFRVLSLESSINDDAFKNWEGGYYFSPALITDAWSYKGKRQGSEQRVYFNSAIYQFLFGPTIFIKTPFFTPSFSALLGYAYLQTDTNMDQFIDNKLQFTASFQLRLQYNFTRRLYASFNLRHTSTHVGKFSGEEEFDSWETFSIGMGYYLPQIEEWLKGIFSR